MNASAPMPQYQCHKKVWALKIAGLVEVEGVMMMTPAEKHFAPSALSADYVAKHRPHVGGYYVVYEDGYKSFSPAKAFEDGYALVRAHDASAQAAEITALRAERDAARSLVIEANNSLYGSQNYFHSTTGGPFDKHHLSRGIEDLKDISRKHWALMTKALAERDALAARLAVPGEEGFTYQVRRAEWRVVRYSVDQYGMRSSPIDEETLSTWPTVELARADLPNHGYEHKHITGRWIPHDKRHDYEEVAVAYREVVVPNLLTALRTRVAGLEGALTTLRAGDYPRPVGKAWFPDKRPSKHDQCTHNFWMYETCEGCIDAFISAALSPSAAQEARDAE